MISPLLIATRSERACRADDNLDAHRSGQMISIRISKMTDNATQLVVDAADVLLKRQAQAREHHRSPSKSILPPVGFAVGAVGAR